MTPEREAALNKAIDEYEALVRDAERYRKLRLHGIYDGGANHLTGEEFDAYVDITPPADA